MQDPTETPQANRVTAIANISSGIDAVRTHVGAFDAIAAGIAEIEAQHPLDVIVGDIQTTKGLTRAIESRAAWRDPRIRVEKARKEAKAPLLALGKTIDAFAADLEGKLRQGEEHYDRQIKAEEARKAAEKAERDRIERARIEAHERRLDGIRASAAVMPPSLTSAEISGRIAALEAVEIDETWDEYADRARVAKRLALQFMQDAHAAAVEREAESARLEAARAELAEQRRLLTEQEAAVAREREEIERQRAEIDERARAAAEAAAKAEQEQIAAQEAQQKGRQPAEQAAMFDTPPASAASQQQAEAPPTPAADAPPQTPADQKAATLRLGEICDRLEFTVSAAFLSSLGIEPCGTDRRAILYRADEWPAICDAIITHLQQARFA